MALLRRGDLSVTEVCFAVGCQSLGTFSTRFTELVGVLAERLPAGVRRQATQGMPSVRGEAGHQTGQESRSAKHAARLLAFSAWTSRIHSAFLPHDDRDAAVAFYCDTLGFELRNDVGYNGMHWLTVGPPDQPDVNIVLYPPGADPGVTDDERRTITEMMAKGTFAMLTLATTTSTASSRSCRPRRRGDAGADRPALGRPRLRLPRPLRQHGPHRRGEVR